MNTLRTELYKHRHFLSQLRREESAQGDETMVTEKKTHKRLTLHDKQTILDLYNEKGLNGTEIAQSTGLKIGAVQYFIAKVKKRRGGVKAVQKDITAAEESAEPRTQQTKRYILQSELDRMVEMWKTGRYAKNAIADKLGIHPTTVGAYIRRYEDTGVIPTASGGRRSAMGTRTTNTKSYRLNKTQPASAPNSIAQLKQELMAEIRQELKSELIRELLGR